MDKLAVGGHSSAAMMWGVAERARESCVTNWSCLENHNTGAGGGGPFAGQTNVQSFWFSSRPDGPL